MSAVGVSALGLSGGAVTAAHAARTWTAVPVPTGPRPAAAPDTGRKPTPTGRGGRAGKHGRRPQEVALAQSTDQVEDVCRERGSGGTVGTATRAHTATAIARAVMTAKSRVRPPAATVTPPSRGPCGVTEALAEAVGAERLAALGSWVEPGDEGRGGRGEGGGGHALAQAGEPEQGGVVGQDEGGGGRGEGDQAAEQDGAGADPVGRRAEDPLEQYLGPVVEGRQSTEHQQGLGGGR